MVVDEFVPLLRHRGLDTGRLGLHGWSMGGYGALLLAGKDHLPVRAVAVSSPALFTSAGATAAGAFDDAADFTAHDVLAHPEWLDAVPAIRIDCGESDPFHDATRSFVGRLARRPAGGFGPGRHDATYWRRVAPAQLRFLGRRL
jgi:dienelactone hydrolase